jgi:hypothetical protein
LWGGLTAGILDIGAVYAYWSTYGATLAGIFQAIAGSLLGKAAYEGGNTAALLGLVLHFGVSFAFAATYVGISGRVSALKAHPILYGPVYGLIAYFIMTFVIVPLSRADFGSDPTPVRIAISLFIHLFLFGLPIALAASRVDR